MLDRFPQGRIFCRAALEKCSPFYTYIHLYICTSNNLEELRARREGWQSSCWLLSAAFPGHFALKTAKDHRVSIHQDRATSDHSARFSIWWVTGPWTRQEVKKKPLTFFLKKKKLSPINTYISENFPEGVRLRIPCSLEFGSYSKSELGESEVVSSMNALIERAKLWVNEQKPLGTFLLRSSHWSLTSDPVKGDNWERDIPIVMCCLPKNSILGGLLAIVVICSSIDARTGQHNSSWPSSASSLPRSDLLDSVHADVRLFGRLLTAHWKALRCVNGIQKAMIWFLAGWFERAGAARAVRMSESLVWLLPSTSALQEYREDRCRQP